MSGSNIVEFQGLLYNLNDYPDKNIIDQLTSFAKDNRYNLAQEIVRFICLKLVDKSIPNTYKLPVFYLMDSIMKYNRDPYVPLFSDFLQHLDVTFYQQFSDEHRVKLEKLFGTWEERILLQSDLLNKMRGLLSQAAYNRIRLGQNQPQSSQLQRFENMNTNMNQVYTNAPMVQVGGGYYVPEVTQVIQRFVSNQGSVDNRGQSITLIHPNGTYQHIQPNQQQLQSQPQQLYTSHQVVDIVQVPSIESLPLVEKSNKSKRFREGDKTKTINLPPSALFHSKGSQINNTRRDNNRGKRVKVESNDDMDVIKIEMQKLLVQLLEDLGQSSDSMTLEDLSKENFELFQNLQNQAEVIVNSRMQSSNYPNIVHTHTNTTEDFTTQSDFTYSTLHQSSFDTSNSNSSNEDFNNNSNNSVVAMNYNYNHQSMSNSDINASVNNNGNAYSTQQILGFINEAPVTISVDRSNYLLNQLTTSKQLSSLSAESLGHCRKLTSRIQNYINRLNTAPKMPSILFGPLPLEPTSGFIHRVNPATNMTKETQKMATPTFRFEDLSKRPDFALNALYAERPHLAEDGQRFKTVSELRIHADKLITARIEKRKQQLRGESNTIQRRSWYSSFRTWTLEDSQNKDTSNSANTNSSNNNGGNNNSSNGMKNSSGNTDAGEEYIVPADENFVRCPISKEAFEKFWDDNEGEYMYRNAVKLLVTQLADEHVYSLGKPTISPSIRYLIVRKPLIVDSWISSGSAASLPEAIQRYRSMGRDENFLNELMKARGDEEDPEDIFVLLELVK